MTAAVQLVEEQRNGLQTDIVELNALRCEIQQLQGCDNVASASLACCRTRPLTLGFGNARLEGAAVPDAVLEVYLEHLLIMEKDELRVNSPMS